jgi:hypothetical protein
MMKETYESPEMEVIMIDPENVITASCDNETPGVPIITPNTLFSDIWNEEVEEDEKDIKDK